MRISAAFNRIKTAGRPGIIPYIMAGDPNLDTTEIAVMEMAADGADLIELGVPFSDPVADGPVIQQAGQRALKSGTTLEGILQLVKRLRQRGLETPLLLMSYYNPIYTRGLSEVTSELALTGVDGLIIPDLPPEEGGELQSELQKHGLDLIYLLAPTSSPERIKEVAAQASGFIYCVSLAGVTGVRRALPDELPQFLSRVRKASSLPIAVGFGISTPQQVKQLGAIADAVIIGSALIDESGPRTDVFKKLVAV